MKLLKTLLASALIISALAGTAFGAMAPRETGEADKNYYQYPTEAEVIYDNDKKASLYKIETLTLQEFRDLMEVMKKQNQERVEDGVLTEKEAAKLALLYKDIEDEIHLKHGFVRVSIRLSDDAASYRYHSYNNYYEFFGDASRIFYTEKW